MGRVALAAICRVKKICTICARRFHEQTCSNPPKWLHCKSCDHFADNPRRKDILRQKDKKNYGTRKHII